MRQVDIRKLALCGILTAIGVVASTLYIPIGASKCLPAQHLINIIGAVTIGPFYGAAAAFVTSLIRNLLGTGTLLAFPGSIFGAILSGLFYRYSGKIYFALGGEVIGSGLFGAIAAYPVAAFILGSKQAALFGFIIPFSVSSLGGAAIAAMLLTALKKTGFFDKMFKNQKKTIIKGNDI